MAGREPSVLGVAVVGGSVVAANVLLGAAVVAGPVGLAVAAAGVAGVALFKSRKAVAGHSRRAMGLASTPFRRHLGSGRPSVRGGRAGVSRKKAAATGAKVGGSRGRGGSARRGGLGTAMKRSGVSPAARGSRPGISRSQNRKGGRAAAAKAASGRKGAGSLKQPGASRKASSSPTGIGQARRNGPSVSRKAQATPMSASVGRKLQPMTRAMRRAIKNSDAKDVLAQVVGDIKTWGIWKKWIKPAHMKADTWIREPKTSPEEIQMRAARAVTPLARKPRPRVPLARDPQTLETTMTNQVNIDSGLPPLFENVEEAIKQAMMIPLFDGNYKGRGVLQVNESLERVDRLYAEAKAAIQRQAEDKFPGDHIGTVYGNLAQGAAAAADYTKQARIAYAMLNEPNIKHMESGTDMWDHSTNRR